MSVSASGPTGAPTVASASLPARRTLRSLLVGETGKLSHQLARYLVVGGLAFVVDFGSLYLLTEFVGLHYLISAAVAFLFGLVTNYCLCRLWVFHRRTIENAKLEFIVFTVIGIVGLGINEGIIWYMGERMHLHYLVAKIFSTGIVLMWNFGARKFLLFR